MRRLRARAHRRTGPSRPLAFIGPEELAFTGRFAADIGEFEYEVLGTTDLSVVSMLLGANITGQLWDVHGADAQWKDLDVDAVLDRFRIAPPDVQAEIYANLLGLVTWLAHNGRLEPSRAQAMLARLSLREPPEVTEMRRAVAQWPDADHARFEQRRLERVIHMRERKGSAN